MDAQFWGHGNTPAMFNMANQNGPFPSNISSYFRRPSKVVKSSSRNNSPRNTGRRRMTTTGQFPARTRSVVDSERASMPQLSQYHAPANRPVSWHPNTMQDMSHLQVPPPCSNESLMPSPYTTVELNGLVTPVSFPIMNEPQIQELISPLEGLSADDAAHAYSHGQDFSMETWLNRQQMKNTNNFHASMYPEMHQPDWYSVDQYDMAVHIPNAPISPNYLPIPEFDASIIANDIQHTDSDKDELVGMGLYDSPAEIQSSSLLFVTAPGAFARKSLKLEDAFEPSSSSDEDDNDDDDEDEDAPGETDDEIPRKQPANSSTTTDQSHNMSHTMVYPMPNEHDLAAMQQWSYPGGSGWI